MKSVRLGQRTSRVEVTNVSSHGLWILIDGQEKFMEFKSFPWFLDVPIGALLDVELQGPGHLYWRQLDVDIAVDSIDHPERFPLVSGRRPNMRMHLPKPRARRSGAGRTQTRLRR